jgi:phosphatidate cytidylyltransferase
VLAQRVITAVVAIPILFALILIGGWPYAVVAAVLLAVGGAEFAHLRYPWRSFATIAAAALCGAIVFSAHIFGGAIVAYPALAGLITVLPFAVLDVSRVRRDETPRLLGSPLTATLYAGVLGSTAVLLRDLDHGRNWVLLALFGTFAVDTSAYFVGRTIGRHKLAPSISPKKTWEGFFGGWAGGAAAIVLLNLILDLDAEPAAIAVLAATLPLAATVGDLFESWLKRRAGVKDASNILPGHGGILDRADSILFTFALTWVIARAFA